MKRTSPRRNKRFFVQELTPLDIRFAHRLRINRRQATFDEDTDVFVPVMEEREQGGDGGFGICSQRAHQHNRAQQILTVGFCGEFEVFEETWKGVLLLL
jgi:hypothetical protein